MTPEQETLIRRHYPSTKLLAEIAELCGCSVFSVCRYAKKLGLPRRKTNARQRSSNVSLAKQLAIVKLRGKRDYKEVADEFGIAPVTVHKIWQKWKE